LLAVTAVRAEDAPLAIAVGSARAGAPSAGAHGPLTMPSEYWLGLIASRASPALQAQLKLPKDQGLVVEALQPESPAAKAGVRQYDILLKGNDKPLTGLHDLFALINQVKDGKLALELLRAGQRETVIVTPTKRPAHEMGEIGMLRIPDGAVVGGSLQNLDRNFMEGRPLEFRVIRPGQILPPGGPTTIPPGGATASVEITVDTKTSLADGSKVEIIRRGSEPAKVMVTHDKDKWEGTSGDLSKIPEKIRPEVEKLLRPAFDHFHVFAAPGEPAGGSATYFSGALAPREVPGRLAVPADIEKRLGEMQKQVDALRRSVEALQSKDPQESAPKPE
jgi:hypothetical protein